MKRSAFLTLLLLLAPATAALALVAPASANSCGSTLAHDPATFTPAHESVVGPTPLLRVKFLDATPHCGIAANPMTLDNLDSSDQPTSLLPVAYAEGDHYVVEYQVNTPLQAAHWQVVASVTEAYGGPSATVAWNFYVGENTGCGTTLAHDPATFTPAHESTVGSTPLLYVEFVDGGGQCGIASSSLTIDNLDASDAPTALAHSAFQSGSRYVVRHQVGSALAAAHYQLVARVTEATSGVTATVAWNFYVAQTTDCGSYTTHEPSSLTPYHETVISSQMPTVRVRFNDGGAQCGIHAYSMVLDDLNSNVAPPSLLVTADVSGAGYVLEGYPAANLPEGYYQVVASITERTSGTSNTVAWNFRVCVTTTDADSDLLGACHENAQGTTDDDADFDDDGLGDGVESAWHPDRNARFCGPSACSFPSPRRKDIYVEMDVMGADHLPAAADLQRIVDVFATSPHASNPDGSAGITIHLDAGSAYPGTRWDIGGGNAVPHDANLGTSGVGCTVYDWAEFQSLKDAHFAPLRQPVYHYMIWAHDLAPDCGGTSGISRGIPASDFIVSLGGWPSHGTADARVGTFIHELGHNLGLYHGGTETGANRKPNFLSVMNYLFQVDGVPRTAGGAYFGYSQMALPALNEATLDESTGLGAGADAWGTRWRCGDVVHVTTNANGPIDWNCGGTIEASVRADVNGDGDCATPTTCDLHEGHRDWGNLVFDGGIIGIPEQNAPAPRLGLPTLPMLTRVIEELTYETYVADRGEEAHADHQD